MTEISISELEELCHSALQKAGIRKQDIEVTVDHLLENEMSGKASHGMVRITEAVKAMKDHGTPQNDPEIVTDAGHMAVLDAGGQLGLVAGKTALDLAAERAKEHGLVLVGVRNYIATSGSMAYYLRRLADQGLVALMGCNSVALVSPPGGRERMIGTNPVGIGIPGSGGDALIADLATSAIAYGKIMVMQDKGEAVPAGVLIDADGNPSTDPADAYNGAILPLADHKGFALGLMVELLAGPLIGAKALKKDLYDEDGLFIIAIDPSKTAGESFSQSVSGYLDAIRSSLKRPGVEDITLAGQRSLKTLQETKAGGTVDVADKTLEMLRALTTSEAA